jgi:DNA-3-methyladenine glycosylase II
LTYFKQYNANNFKTICDYLAKKDTHLKDIILKHGYPPMWTRPATFQTLILIIFEQQVSLASAYAAFKKLKEKVGYVTPQKILGLSDEEMRACYFTRQKMSYARLLATAVVNKKLVLKKLPLLTDDEIRAILKQHKGIGDWSVDVYLMHALQRTNLFPLGDIALVNSLKEVKGLPKETTKEALYIIGATYAPYRTVATMIYWHAYIKKRNIKILG